MAKSRDVTKNFEDPTPARVAADRDGGVKTSPPVPGMKPRSPAALRSLQTGYTVLECHLVAGVAFTAVV
jgi:hypothetical protein